MMDKKEFTELVADIKAHGLNTPIVVFKDTISKEEKLLDGRNRLLACEKAGVRPVFETRTLKGKSPVEWVISQNGIRRHLTASQKAVVALEFEKLLAKEARERQGTRTDIKAKLPESSLGQARDKAAELVGVSPRYVSDAKAVQKESPALAKKVKEGKISLSVAKKAVNPGKRTCTLTAKNVADTRCLSMAKERIWYTEGKIELLIAALKDSQFENSEQEIIKTLKIYRKAFQDFSLFLEKGLQRINKIIGAL